MALIALKEGKVFYLTLKVSVVYLIQGRSL